MLAEWHTERAKGSNMTNSKKAAPKRATPTKTAKKAAAKKRAVDKAAAKKRVVKKAASKKASAAGRPHGLKERPDVFATVTECQRLGMPLTETATAIGFTDRACHHWLKEGREIAERIAKAEMGEGPAITLTDKESLSFQFLQAFEKGKAAFVRENLQNITAQAPESWQASAWLLERRRPDQFSKHEVLDAQVVEVKESPADAMKRKLAEIKARSKGGSDA